MAQMSKIPKLLQKHLASAYRKACDCQSNYYTSDDKDVEVAKDLHHRASLQDAILRKKTLTNVSKDGSRRWKQTG